MNDRPWWARDLDAPGFWDWWSEQYGPDARCSTDGWGSVDVEDAHDVWVAAIAFAQIVDGTSGR